MSESGPGPERERGREADLSAIAGWVGDAFSTHYEPRNPEVRGILTRLLAAEKKNHFFKQRGRMTFDDQSIVTVAFFALKCLRRLISDVPLLSEALVSAHAQARSSAGAVAAWSRLDPERYSDGRIPGLLFDADWVDPRLLLNQEGADLVPDRLKRDGDLPRLRSSFELWRNAQVYGLDVASRNQDIQSLERFNPAIVSAAHRTLATKVVEVEAFQQAYFEHLEREVQRARYPFGLEVQENRDAMVLAVSLAVESETSGALHPVDGSVPYLPYKADKQKKVDDDDEEGEDGNENLEIVERRLLAPTELYSAFRSTIARINQKLDLQARPALPFDLVRAAASVQSDAELFHELPPVLQNGWVPILQSEGFGVSAAEGASSMRKQSSEPSPRLVYARELLRLIPYASADAAALATMSPAGSPRKIAWISQNLDLGDFKGQPRTDAIVGRIRSEILDGFYRERMGADQRAQIEERPLRKVDTGLTTLLVTRLKSVFKAANERPRETTFEPESSEQRRGRKTRRVALGHDDLLTQRNALYGLHLPPTRGQVQRHDAERLTQSTNRPTKEADNAAREAEDERKHRFGVGVTNWIGDFLELIPVYIDVFRSYREWMAKNARPTPADDLDAVRYLDAFYLWLQNDVAAREAGVSAEAESINKEARAAGRGRMLPSTLHDVELADSMTLSLADALKNWAAELPVGTTGRTRARQSIELALRRIYQSPVWIALAKGVPLEDIDESAEVTIATTISALRKKNDLGKLLPGFLVELMDDDTDVGQIFDEKDLTDAG